MGTIHPRILKRVSVIVIRILGPDPRNPPDIQLDPDQDVEPVHP